MTSGSGEPLTNRAAIAIIGLTLDSYPSTFKHLQGRARWLANAHYPTTAPYKDYDYFLYELERMISNVYYGNLGGEFTDILGNLIYGQIGKAVNEAWTDQGGDGPLPNYLIDLWSDKYVEQQSFVDAFYREIIDARVDGTPVDDLIGRAELWANRYNEAYNEAILKIVAEEGGNLTWQLGATEKHCSTCSALDGIVAFASEWDEIGVQPQAAPNYNLECQGWRCDCSLSPTDQRRSPNAYDRITTAIGG